MMTCSRVKLTIGGDVIWDVDYPAGNQCVIDGTDIWSRHQGDSGRLGARNA